MDKRSVNVLDFLMTGILVYLWVHAIANIIPVRYQQNAECIDRFYSRISRKRSLRDVVVQVKCYRAKPNP